ncbi:MAG: ketoacyl-ACP synthase III [Armatimonadetes bacterium]|nr:ketoacyl-ACP synthase III [Armatimonadota bacterium]
MEVRGACIKGLGAYVPERVLTNQDLCDIVDTSDEWIVEHTGIRERRILADDQASSDLAFEAARKALENAGISVDDLDMIIVATITPDMPFPATASIVQDMLGAKGVGTFDVVTGCTGWVQALVTGSQYIQTGAADHVLVIAAESLTRITNWTDRSTCVLFGDGACAAVLGPCAPGQGLLAFAMDTQGDSAELLMIPAGGSRTRLTPEALADYQHLLQMDGHEVFKLAVRGVPEIARRCMEKAGLEMSQVDVCVLHQANLRIIDAAAKRLDIPYERMVINLDKYGNTSAASVGIALDEYARETGLKPGDVVLLVAFGAGFSLASAVFRWT